VNTTNDPLINSVIAWSFYPKLLTREGKGWRNIANNQPVTIHPTSVNRTSDPSVTKYLSYYHIMQSASTRSKHYNAFETSVVEDFPLMLLAGEADVRLHSGVLSVDSNRLRFSVREWKGMLAVKVLGMKVREILQGVFRDPQGVLSFKQKRWMEIWEGVWRAREERRERDR
jgi:ATP-dependent RNA helicase DHX29